jgi:hypothetical protein
MAAPVANPPYLKEVPNSTKYTVSYTAGTGTTESTVTGSIVGGGAC